MDFREMLGLLNSQKNEQEEPKPKRINDELLKEIYKVEKSNGNNREKQIDDLLRRVVENNRRMAENIRKRKEEAPPSEPKPSENYKVVQKDGKLFKVPLEQQDSTDIDIKTPEQTDTTDLLETETPRPDNVFNQLLSPPQKQPKPQFEFKSPLNDMLKKKQFEEQIARMNKEARYDLPPAFPQTKPSPFLTPDEQRRMAIRDLEENRYRLIEESIKEAQTPKVLPPTALELELKAINDLAQEYENKLKTLDRTNPQQIDEINNLVKQINQRIVSAKEKFPILYLPPDVIEYMLRNPIRIPKEPELIIREATTPPIPKKQLSEKEKIKQEAKDYVDLVKYLHSGLTPEQFAESQRLINQNRIVGLAAEIPSGILGIVEGVLGAVDAVTDAAGLTKRYEKSEAVKLIEGWRKYFTPMDRDLMHDLVNGIGSMYGFMGVARIAQMMLKGIKTAKTAYKIATAAMTIAESLTEAGSVYNESGDYKAAAKSFFANIILIQITNQFGIRNPEKIGVIKRALLSANLEGLQEFGQTIIEYWSQNKQIDKKVLIEALKSYGIGGIIGAGGSLFEEGVEERTKSKSAAKYEPVFVEGTHPNVEIIPPDEKPNVPTEPEPKDPLSPQTPELKELDKRRKELGINYFAIIAQKIINGEELTDADKVAYELNKSAVNGLIKEMDKDKRRFEAVTAFRNKFAEDKINKLIDEGKRENKKIDVIEIKRLIEFLTEDKQEKYKEKLVEAFEYNLSLNDEVEIISPSENKQIKSARINTKTGQLKYKDSSGKETSVTLSEAVYDWSNLPDDLKEAINKFSKDNKELFGELIKFEPAKGGKQDAIQEPSPNEIFQQQQEETGSTRGERGRVEQGEQGQEIAEEGEQEKTGREGQKETQAQVKYPKLSTPRTDIIEDVEVFEREDIGTKEITFRQRSKPYNGVKSTYNSKTYDSLSQLEEDLAELGYEIDYDDIGQNKEQLEETLKADLPKFSISKIVINEDAALRSYFINNKGEVFTIKKSGKTIPPTREQVKNDNLLQLEIMQKAGIPEEEMADYALSSIADGQLLRDYIEDIKKGNLTIDEAVERVKRDYQKMKSGEKEGAFIEPEAKPEETEQTQEAEKDADLSHFTEEEKKWIGKYQKARKRGYAEYTDNDGKVRRVFRKLANKVKKVAGKKTKIAFAFNDKEDGYYAVISAKDLTPSHNFTGERLELNPQHFIPEAQPKDREVGRASANAIRNIRDNMNFEEISVSGVAYTGSPVVNERGEVIQGNGRAIGILEHFKAHGSQAYKQALLENAQFLGLDPQQIEQIEDPVLVRVVKSDDKRSIQLGQYTMQDLESGGKKIFDPVNLSRRLSEDVAAQILDEISKVDEDLSITEAIKEKGTQIVQTLVKNGILTEADVVDYLIDSKGELKKEAVELFEGVLLNILFRGGDVRLNSMFQRLPYNLRQGILRSLPYIIRIGGRIRTSIQKAIELTSGYLDYIAKKETTPKQYPIYNYLKQGDLFGDYKEKFFTDFEIMLAYHFVDNKNNTQKSIIAPLKKTYELMQGVAADLFSEGTKGVSREEAFSQAFESSFRKYRKEAEKFNYNVEEIIDEIKNEGGTNEQIENILGEDQQADIFTQGTQGEEQGTQREKQEAQPEETRQPEQPKPKRTVKPEIKDALNDFLDELNKPPDFLATTLIPINPQLIAKGAKVVSLLVKEGVYRFADIVETVAEQFGKITQEMFEALKLAYTNFVKTASDEIRDKLDKNISNIQLSDILGGEYGRDRQKDSSDTQRDTNRPQEGLFGTSGADRRTGVAGRTRRIVFADEEQIPQFQETIQEGQYEIDENQRFGANLILDSFFNKGNKAFLLADGTGVGKTRQLLVVAEEYSKKTGKKVLIVTQDDKVIAGFKREAQATGIDPDKFEIVDYDNVRTNKTKSKEYGLIIFDEAHNLRNQESKKTIRAKALKSDHKIYATATPMDKVEGAVYFVGELTGWNRQDILRRLGLRIDLRTNPYNNQIYEVLVYDTGSDYRTVIRNLLNLRAELISQGKMLRREYPFYGTIQILRLPANQDKYNLEQKIHDHYQEKMRGVGRSRRYSEEQKKEIIKRIGTKRHFELQALNEESKIDLAVKNAIDDVNAGKAVVIFAERINQSTLDSFGIKVKGTIDEIVNQLEAKGIKVSKIYGEDQQQKLAEMKKFQNGETQVVVGTPQSMSTGIDLDDQIGNRPRSVYILTYNYSAILNEQMLGRVSRKNTQSPSEVYYIIDAGSMADNKRLATIENKVRALASIQRGKILEGIDIVSDIVETEQMVVPKSEQLEKLGLKEIADLFAKSGIEIVTDQAEIDRIVGKEKLEQIEDSGGKLLGFTDGNRIYLLAEGMNINTPVHEYTHLWFRALEIHNPTLFDHAISLLKQTKEWQRVKSDPNYKHIRNNDKAVASEVLSRLSGNKAAEIIGKEKTKLREKLINLLSEFWAWVKDTFTNWSKEEVEKVTLNDLVMLPIKDLAKGVNLKALQEQKAKQQTKRQNALNKVGDIVTQILRDVFGVNFNKKPTLEFEIRIPYDKLNKMFQNAFGDTSKVIREISGRAYDYGQEYIEFIKQVIPVKSHVKDVFKVYGDEIRDRFLLMKEGGKTNDTKINTKLNNLLAQANYEMIETKTPEEVYSFRGDYREDKDELICTIEKQLAPERLESNYIFWLRRPNADKIPPADELTQDNITPEWAEYLEKKGRKNPDGTFNLSGLKKEREDPYSTSSICVQLSKNGRNIKMIGRYNHQVEGNPDAVYGAKLDEVIKGLEKAIYDYYNVVKDNIVGEHYNIAKDNDNRYYKYNHNLYLDYFGDGVILDNGVAIIVDKDIARNINGVLIDQQEKKLSIPTINRSYNLDYVFYGKDEITFGYKGFDFYIKTENGHISEIESNITLPSGDGFIQDLIFYSFSFQKNPYLKRVAFSKLQGLSYGSPFCYECENLTEVVMPEIKFLPENSFVRTGIKELRLPKLEQAAKSFNHNKNLKLVEMPELLYVNFSFSNNEELEVFTDGKVIQLNDSFNNNGKLKEIAFEHAEHIEWSLNNNYSLQDISIPNAKNIINSINNNGHLSELALDKAITIKDSINSNKSIKGVRSDTAETIDNSLKNNGDLQIVTFSNAKRINNSINENGSIKELIIKETSKIVNSINNNHNIHNLDIRAKEGDNRAQIINSIGSNNGIGNTNIQGFPYIENSINYNSSSNSIAVKDTYRIVASLQQTHSEGNITLEDLEVAEGGSFSWTNASSLILPKLKSVNDNNFIDVKVEKLVAPQLEIGFISPYTREYVVKGFHPYLEKHTSLNRSYDKKIKIKINDDIDSYTLNKIANGANVDIYDKYDRLVIRSGRTLEYHEENLDKIPLTLSVFERNSFKKLRGKQVDKETIQKLLKQAGIKKIEIELINHIIDKYFADDNVFSYNKLEALVRTYLMPLEKIRSNLYAEYNSKAVRLKPHIYNPVTIILNMPKNLGITGHFRDAYLSSQQTPKGLFGHFRAWEIHEILHIAEFQSDFYQKYYPKEILTLAYYETKHGKDSQEYKKVEELYKKLSKDREDYHNYAKYLKDQYGDNIPEENKRVLQNLQGWIESRKKEFDEYIKEAEQNFDADEKQIIALDSVWEKRLLQEIINYALNKNHDLIRIPDIKTVALIQGYIPEDTGGGTANIPYTIIHSFFGDPLNSGLEAGDIIEYLGENYYVVYSDNRTIKVVKVSQSARFNEDLFAKEKAEKIYKIIEKKLAKHFNNIENITYEEYQEKGLPPDLPYLREVYDSLREYAPNGINLTEHKNIIMRGLYNQVQRDLRSSALDTVRGTKYDGFNSFREVFTLPHSDFILYNSEDVETLQQPYEYRQADSSFTIENVPEMYRRIIKRYMQAPDLLKKMYGDAINIRHISDRYGYGWYEITIGEEVKNRPMAVFQKEHKRVAEVYSQMSPEAKAKFREQLARMVADEWSVEFGAIEDANGVTYLLDKVIRLDPDKADFTTLWEEAFHQSMVALAQEETAKKMLKDAGWDGKGEIWDVDGNESLREAHERLADEFIDWVEKKESEPKTFKERVFKTLQGFWNAIAKALFKMGMVTHAGYFEMLYSGDLKKQSLEKYGKLADASSRLAQDDDDSLVGVHNAHPQAVRMALRKGVMVAPSVAIIKAKFGHAGFGDISLVASKELIKDPNTRVYDRDAYTPRHPRVYYKINETELNKIIEPILDTIDDIELRNIFVPSANDVADGLRRNGIDGIRKTNLVMYHFAKEKNKLPEKSYRPPYLTILPETPNRKAIVDSLLEKHPKLKDPKTFDIFVHQDVREENVNAMREFAYDYIRATVSEAGRRTELFYKVRFFSTSTLQQDILALMRDDKVFDAFGYSEQLKKITNEYKKEYEDFIESKYGKAIEGEYFKHKEKEYKYTPQNVLRVFGKKIIGGEQMASPTIGFVAAKSSRELFGLDEIRAAKSRIVSLDEERVFLSDLHDSILEMLEFVDSNYSQIQTLDNLLEAAGDMAAKEDFTINGAKKAMRKYGLSTTYENVYRSLITAAYAIKNLRTAYFEAKPIKPVKLEEFVGAVVPESTDQDIIDGLKEAGLTVETYNNSPVDRAEKIKKIARERQALFQRSDKKKPPKKFERALNYASKHPLLKNWEISVDEPQIEYWTKQQILDAGYSEEFTKSLYKLKEGDFGYEPNQEKYAVEIAGFTEYNPEESIRRISVSSGATKSAIAEEIVHAIYKELEKENPQLLSAIEDWTHYTEKWAREEGLDLPTGEELFVQAYVFNKLGYGEERPDIADLIEIPADILTEFEAILNQGGANVVDLFYDENRVISDDMQIVAAGDIIYNDLKARDGEVSYSKWRQALKRYQIIGERGAKRLDKLFNEVKMQKLEEAKELEKLGYSNEKIWRMTGWQRGADGMWRAELDNYISQNPDFKIKEEDKERGYVTVKPSELLVGDVIDVYDLDKIVNIHLVKDSIGTIKGFVRHNRETGTFDIVIFEFDYSSPTMNTQSIRSLAHEFQHIVQGIEGFANGTNDNNEYKIVNPLFVKYWSDQNQKNIERYYALYESDSFNAEMRAYRKEIEELNKSDDFLKIITERDFIIDKYPTLSEIKRLENTTIFTEPQQFLSPNEVYFIHAGEIEARNVERRIFMSKAERQAKSPELTENLVDMAVSRDRQIIARLDIAVAEQGAVDMGEKEMREVWKEVKETNNKPKGQKSYQLKGTKKDNGFTQSVNKVAVSLFGDIVNHIKNTKHEKELGIRDSRTKKYYRELTTSPPWFVDKVPQAKKIWNILDRYFSRNINEETAILREDYWKNAKAWRKLPKDAKQKILESFELYEKELYSQYINNEEMNFLTWEEFVDKYGITGEARGFILETLKPMFSVALDMVKDVDRYKLANNQLTNPYLEDYYAIEGRKDISSEKKKEWLQIALNNAVDEFIQDNPSLENLLNLIIMSKITPHSTDNAGAIIEALEEIWRMSNVREDIIDNLVEKKYEKIDGRVYLPTSRLNRKYYISAKRKPKASDLLLGKKDETYFETSDSLEHLQQVKKELQQAGYTDIEINHYSKVKEDLIENVITQDNLIELVIASGVEPDNPIVEKLLTAITSKGFTKHFIPKVYAPGFRYTEANFEETIYKYITAVPLYKNRTIGKMEFFKELSNLKANKVLKPSEEKYLEKLYDRLNTDEKLVSKALRMVISVWYLALAPAYWFQQIVQPFFTFYPMLPTFVKEINEMVGAEKISSAQATKKFWSVFTDSVPYLLKKIADKLSRVFLGKPAEFKKKDEFWDFLVKMERQGVAKPLRTLEIVGQNVNPERYYDKNFWSRLIGAIGTLAKSLNVIGLAIEDITRVQGIKALYDLSKEAGLKGEELEDFVSYAVARSYGSSSGILSKPPTWFVRGNTIGATASQIMLDSYQAFKNFGYMNYGQWGKLQRELMQDKLAKGLMRKIATQYLFGGFKYMMWSSTMISFLTMLAELFDIDKDPEEEYKKLFKSLNGLLEGFGDSLEKGLLSTLTQIDLSALFAQTAPLEEPFAKDLAEVVFGVPYSAAKDIYKGKLPRGIPRGVFQTVPEWEREGVKYGNRTLIKKENISGYQKNLKRASFQPIAVSEAYEKEGARQFKSSQFTDRIRDQIEDEIIPEIKRGNHDKAKQYFKNLYGEMKSEGILTEEQLKRIDNRMSSFISVVVLPRLENPDREFIKNWKNNRYRTIRGGKSRYRSRYGSSYKSRY